ncbi:MAG: PorV/PorQ family protein [Melioribacteraceae bacterium]|nr:PorV/PorQ family protein [Melioribacteraceae bacterium]
MTKKIILILFASVATIFAQDAGNTGLSFLKIGPSARSIGAGDLGFLDSDPSSVFHNPASVTQQSSEGVQFTHQGWIQDLTSEILHANFSMIGLPFTVGVNTTKISGFEARTLPTDTPDATFNANYFYGSLSTGFNLIDNVEFGISIKYLYESLLSDDASGTGYDFGLLYTDLIENLVIGASIRNLGSMEELRNEKTKLPSDLIVNARYSFEFENSQFGFSPIAGIQKYLEQDKIHLHVGTEASYDEQFFLRAGYVSGYDSKGLTTGAGFYWNGFNIDYAYTPFSYGIGNANTISLMYTF